MKDYFKGQALPEFDLILLGVGEDGHTASLFPGSDALSEKRRLAVPVFHASTATWRITLTLPVLNNASCVLFLVSGRAKARAIAMLLGESEGEGDEYPASMVKPEKGNAFWLLDKEAASEL